jgi:hypothetical protein
MIAESGSRRRIVKSKLSIVAFHSRVPRDSVLAFLNDIACGFPDFQKVHVAGTESEFISYLIRALFNRLFNNLVVFDASAHCYFNVSS